MKTHAELKRLALQSQEAKVAYDALEGQYVELKTVFQGGSPRAGIDVALMLLRDGYVGLARAAEVAGVSASEMMDICADHHVSLVGYSKEELAEEVEQFPNQTKPFI